MIQKIHRKFLICVIVLISQLFSYAQVFNNEWINYDQQYFRITLSKDGLYRLTYSELLTAGIPVNTIDPRNIQLFHNGTEQYIYIEGEGSLGVFDPNGYIEFYGKRNRGELDSVFFRFPDNRINPDYSFYNDTSSYFITWNNSINNRRTQTINDLDFTPYISSAQNFCSKHIRINYTGAYYQGRNRYFFAEGEGYFDNAVISDNSPVTKTIQTPNIYNTSTPTEIELAVVGIPATDFYSSVPHHLKVNIMGTTMVDEKYTGYDFVRKQLGISSQNISSSISFVFSSHDTEKPTIPDRNAVSYIDIKYPHKWEFGNNDYYEFYLKPNNQSDKDYIEISDFNTSSNVVLYDLTNNYRIITSVENNKIKALVPDADTERFLVLRNQSGYMNVTGIHEISNNNRFVDYMSINPTHDYIIITHKSLMNAAEQYASYRNSTGANVILVDIDQLYYQYAYGVVKHPVSIRNFCNYSYNLKSDFKHLFLLGKSIHSIDFRKNSTNFKNCLVPSAGNPSSDNLLTARLTNTLFDPLFATGRFSARNEKEVLDYLDKIIEYESLPAAEWMKNVVHFGGGAYAHEQNTFANYLNNYKQIIEDTLFGAKVSSFFKTSSEPVQISQFDSIRNLIENGTTLMTFFGHASASGFDQGVDNPENYSNRGKYPFILANSCFPGNIHLASSNSVSENWVNISQKGAIGFLGSVGAGIGSNLNLFSLEFYKNMTYKNYNKSIGVQKNNTIKVLQTTENANNIFIEALLLEMTLHGDPGLIINSHELPDLVLEPSGISFIPNEITTISDSFDVEVVIKNIGRAVSDTFLVTADRTFPNNNTENYYLAVDGCNYMKTIKFRFPVDKLEGPGMNSIRFFADAGNNIEELDKTNNETTVNFLIKSGDIYPIYPYKYSIYPDNEVILMASTIDPFIELSEFVFRIDTTDAFNSQSGNPMAQGTILESGGIVSWKVPFSLKENTVYYWQAAYNHSNPEKIVWRESTFIYIPGEEGWSQAHFYQFKENDYRFIDYNKPERLYEYVTTPKQLHCYNTGVLNSNTYFQIRWTIDGSVMNGEGDYSSMGTAPAMMVVVIDPHTLTAWPSNKEAYGHRNYPHSPARNRPDYFYVFNSGSGSSPDIDGLQSMNSLLNIVPKDHYILVYSWGNGYFEQWPENIYDTFENMGSIHIRNIENTHPYIFFTKKGDTSFTQEKVGYSYSDVINLYVDLETNFNYGNIKSVLVGPSNNWQSLHWDFKSTNTSDNDEIELKVYGINKKGDENLLMENIIPGNFDIYNLENSIDYTEYPHVKLDFFTKNDSSKVPAQLTKWQLKFEPGPETAIDPNSGYHFCCDTIGEGGEIKFAVATKNISNYDMDSLRVKYWLQDNSYKKTLIDLRTLRPHPAGDVIIDTVTYSTLGLSGINSIWVQYNPINEETGTYYQQEQYYFNNIAAKYFYVQRDVINPLLDVSFDGRYIMDGDVVSARPEILIQLKDENKFLALNDTSLFRVFITDMQSGEEERVYFATRNHPEEDLIWVPAVLPNNSCQIIYTPVFENDGIYQLRVQATDVSKNESGKYDYIIRFEVINNSTITHLLNYPNPFSTSTRFVFELTGYQVPDDLRIEIFTVTGRLVKVIFLDELGPIRVGRNITEYAWNGKDMYGDQLANGIYFYRVKATIDGQDIEHRNTEADKYFKKEIGKMYLLR